MVLKLLPEPEEGDPPVAVHANVYGLVPPDALEVHETAVPTVPVAGQVITTASASGFTVIVADPLPVFDVESVTVTLTVLEPLTVNVVENVAPVAVEFGVLLTDHAYENGAVPPETVAVNVTDCPTDELAGPETVTVKVGAPPTTTVADAVAVLAFVSVAVTLIVKVPAAL